MAKILLAEDDVNLREIFEMRLKAEGFDVVTAGDGEEALVVATKELPDLAVIDVMMPKISGFEMLETLRSNPQTAGIKAIMMTALGQAEDRERGQKLGVLKYLVKSQVTLEDFVRSIHEILDSSQNNNQQRSSMEPTQQPTQDDSMQSPSPTPTPDPMSAAPAATPPATDMAESSQQEAGEVQQQVDSFAASPTPAPSAPPEPTTDDGTTGTPAPSSDPSGMPGPTAPAPEPAATEAPVDPASDESAGAAPGSTVEPSTPPSEQTPQQ